MKYLLSLFAVFLFTASATDVSGTWKAAVDTPNGPIETTFKFQVDGGKLTGTAANSFSGELPISEGKIDGDSLSFTVTANFNGNEFKLNYKGKISADEIKLTVEIPGADRTFEMTAKRA